MDSAVSSPWRGSPLDTLYSPEGGGAAGFEIGLGIEMPEDFDQRRHQPGPSGLMTGADASAVVAMEIFVEQQVIPPVVIVLELRSAAEHRPPARLVAQKDPSQPIGDFAGDFE